MLTNKIRKINGTLEFNYCCSNFTLACHYFIFALLIANSNSKLRAAICFSVATLQ